MNKNYCYVFLLSLIALLFPACSTTSRIEKLPKKYIPSSSAPIKVLLEDEGFNLSYVVESPVILYTAGKAVAVIKEGNLLNFSIKGNGIKLKIADSIFEAPYFQMKPMEEGDPVSYHGRNYRGNLKVVRDGNTINIINQLPLEDYLKGVVPAIWRL
jgi:peptidoglycan hydrolase-like amidase